MRIGWLSTGRDGLDLEIAAVFCDRLPGESPESDRLLALADGFGIPCLTLSSAASWRDWWRQDVPHDRPDLVHKTAERDRWRVAFHDQAMELLDPLAVDLLVLAGYMLVTSPAMCERYLMLNLHPALPGGPTGTWQEVIWELLRQEARETGAMIHLATAELDRGPVVTYCSFPIVGRRFDPLWLAFRRKLRDQGIVEIMAAEGEAEPLFAEVRRQGERREIPLLYQTVRQFVEGRLLVRDGLALALEGELPLSLTDEVEEELRRGSGQQ
jgi:phosphoribosylglycinamide formyltransferase-1